MADAVAGWDAEVAREVLTFWFDEVGRKGWFGGGEALDRDIFERFLEAHKAVTATDDAALLHSSDEALAAIIVLDQFSRQMFRGTGRAFESDAKALRLAMAAVERGYDKAVDVVRRVFFYLPYEHSEDLDVQHKSVELLTSLGDPEFKDYSERHRDVILKYGRYPHRNEALGRVSTAEELEYLAQPGAGF